MKSLFIAGTDTDVGKTCVTAALITMIKKLEKPYNGSPLKNIDCDGFLYQNFEL